MTGSFFYCSEVVVITKKSEKKKGKNKNMEGGKINEEDGNSPSYSISAAEVMIIRSVHLGSQCD